MSKNPTMTNKIDYERFRPFLIIDLYNIAADHVKSHIKGWTEDPKNWISRENPYVVDRINDKHRKQASVIIDLLNETLIKNRFSGTPGEEVIAHYRTKYASQIAEAMDMWRAREGIAAAQASGKDTFIRQDQMQHGGLTVTMV